MAAAGYRYRFYPTPEQEKILVRTFGCVRLVCNKALETKKTAWREERKNLSYGALSERLSHWK